MTTLALNREYVAAPWIVLPTDDQAVIIGQLARFEGPDWTLTVDPSLEMATGRCAHDWDHGVGVVRVGEEVGVECSG